MTALDPTMHDDAGQLRLARLAVFAAFFINGFMVGHWATKIPVLVDRLGLSEAVLGRMIILFGVGAVIALVMGAYLVTRFGSVVVLRWTSLLLAPSFVFMSLTPTIATTALAMVWLGVFLGAMDNAMNANGVGVETAMQKPSMSAFHGFWSLGGMTGALTGGAMIANLGEMGHAVVVGAIALAIALWALRHYRPDDITLTSDGAGDRPNVRIPRNPGIYVIGILTMLAFAPEGTVIDWSALYLRDEHGAPTLITGYAFAAFAATMAFMRFLGDGLRLRLGDRPTFVASALVAAFGLVIAGTAPTLLLVCLGFFISGLGMANIVPVLFSAAGTYPGLPPAVGIAVATTFGYAGLLFIPAFVGAIAEIWSLALVFTGWGAILIAVGGVGLLLPYLNSSASGRDDSASARKS